MHHSLEEKLDAIECESVNVEVRRNIVKKYVLYTLRDLDGGSTGMQESHGLHRKSSV